MNIVQPYARILNIDQYGYETATRGFATNDGKALLRKIEWCARISHRSEDKMEASSLMTVQVDWERTEKFLRAVVLQHGDWSVTEHASVSVEFLVDRGITHELVRHRLFSYTQESTRFVNYKKKMPPNFIQPDELYGGSQLDAWDNAIKACEWNYELLIEAGLPPQIARSVLPNSLASKIVMTGNLRSWRHFLVMRTTAESHPQMRQVTVPLLAEFQKAIPILYEDIEPMSKQAEQMRRCAR